METMPILLATLPIPVLVTIIVSCLTLLIIALLLIAFIPEMAGRIVLVLNALQRLSTYGEVKRVNNSGSSINNDQKGISVAELEQEIISQEQRTW